MNLRRITCARFTAALCLIAAAASTGPTFADAPGGLGETRNEVAEGQEGSVHATQVADGIAPDQLSEAQAGSSSGLINLPNVLAPAGPVAAPGSLLIAVSTVSYHTQDTGRMNAVNTGIGVGYELSQGIDVLAGTFKNSYSEQSRYAMLRARINDEADPVAFHVCGGYLDGYVDSRGKSVFPVAMALDAQYGPLVLIAQPAPSLGGLTLSLWFLFDGSRWLGK